MLFINKIPFYLFSFIFSNIFYISFISVFNLIDFSKHYYLLQTLFFISVILLIRKYKKIFEVKRQKYFYLLFPYLLIIFLRWPIYTKVHDDLTYYLVAGEYTKNLWTNNHFYPTYAIYFYNALPLFYNFFVNLVGLRITLFFSMLSLSFWMVSLCLRFKNLVNNKFQKLLIDFFFISFPFWPHLMATHGTFMADFFSLVLVLEAFYQFIIKVKNKTFALISFIVAGLVKQSSIFYVTPIFLYLIFKNFRNINWLKSLIVIGFFSIFFFKLYKEVSNPLPVCFLNFVFKTPVCPLNSNLNLGIPFGGKNIFEKIIWPLIAQFKSSFAEGFVSKYAKIYFTIFLLLPYLISFIFIITKRKIFYLLLFFSFLFWSFYVGYARWVIPLIGVSWIYIIIDSLVNIKINLKRIQKMFLYFLIILLSLSSIKTDFGWRPYHNINFYKQLYFEGLGLIFKDRYIDIKKEFKKEFDDIEAIAIVRGEKAYFYGFIGSLYGKTLIEAHNLDIYKKFLDSPKISNHLKKNLSNLINKKKVLLVVDTMSVPEEYVKDNYFYKNYSCKRIGNFKDIPQIQFSSFSSIVKYECEKNKY